MSLRFVKSARLWHEWPMHAALNWAGLDFLAQVVTPEKVDFWEHEVLPGFVLWRILLALLLVILSLAFKNGLHALLGRILLRTVTKKAVAYEDLILEAAREPFGAFILLFGLELATQALIGGLGQFRIVNLLVTTTFEVALGVILIWTFYRFVNVASAFFENVILGHDPTLSPQLTPLFANTLRVVVIVIGFLTLLSTFHINVVSLLAGLGVGGIAVALALQDPLGNFFGSLTLIADRSFRVGDWIQMGASANRVDGIVEEIGFRSTRVRTFARTQLTIPNNMLCKGHHREFLRHAPTPRPTKNRRRPPDQPGADSRLHRRHPERPEGPGRRTPRRLLLLLSRHHAERLRDHRQLLHAPGGSQPASGHQGTDQLPAHRTGPGPSHRLPHGRERHVARFSAQLISEDSAHPVYQDAKLSSLVLS